MSLKDDLAALSADSVSGAAELLQKAATIALKYAETVPAGEIAEGLLSARPDMASVINLALEIKKHAGMAGVAEITWAFLHEHRKSFARAVNETSKLLESGMKVLTYSRSSTVLAALLEASSRGKSFSVYLTEGRPGMEGINLARELSNVGISVVIGPDSALAGFLKECDVVIVGADAVGPEYFYNKTGTLGLALLSKALEKPLYLSVSRDKLLTQEGISYYHVREMPGEEIISPVPEGVTVFNRYFEAVPVGLVTRMVGL
jgi:translation initiation factor 2B subunit (eIF-2B alpha/beta/delta family)